MTQGQIGTIDRFTIGVEEAIDTWVACLEEKRKNKALFRKMRNEGLTSEQAHGAMALMGIRKEDYMYNEGGWEAQKEVGHKLPYYHGKRRF